MTSKIMITGRTARSDLSEARKTLLVRRIRKPENLTRLGFPDDEEAIAKRIEEFIPMACRQLAEDQKAGENEKVSADKQVKYPRLLKAFRNRDYFHMMLDLIAWNAWRKSS